MTEKKEVVVVENPAQALLSKALEQKVDVQTIEKLMDLQDRWDKKQAKIAFDEAMSSFQGDCPVIKKSKQVKNKDGTRRYSYAPLDVIVQQVGDLIAKNGLSYGVTVNQDAEGVEAIVKVTHSRGHAQESSFKVPVDPESFMNKPQKFASALTFAKRYAFCNAFGILTGDEDDDSRTASGGDDKKPKSANPDDVLKNSLVMVNACKSLKALDEMLERVNKAKTLSADQKKALTDAIAIKNAELTKTDAVKAGQ